jgi:acetoacetyl-CoA synthetase
MSEHGANGVNGANVAKGHLNDSIQLWRHPHPESTEFHAFQQHIQKKYSQSFPTYNDFWQWSIDHPAAFWEAVWLYTGIKAHKTYDSVW